MAQADGPGLVWNVWHNPGDLAVAKPNPRKALAAFLPASIPIPGTDVAVRPLTLAAYAILEKIGSPLVVPSEGVTALDVIPTLYVLTHDPVEVMSEDLAAASVAWADGLAPSALIPIEEAARRQVRAWLDVLPEVEKKKTSPRATDGSPNSPDGPAKPTDGPGARWLSRLRRRLSRFFSGSGGSGGATNSSSSPKWRPQTPGAPRASAASQLAN